MENLTELKDLLVSIVGRNNTDLDIMHNLRNNFSDLKRLVNSYEPKKTYTEDKDSIIQDLLIRVAKVFYADIKNIDKDNFSISITDEIDLLKNEYGESLNSGFPAFLCLENGEECIDFIEEVGFRNGKLYIKSDCDFYTTGKVIPETYKIDLIEYLESLSDLCERGVYRVNWF